LKVVEQKDAGVFGKTEAWGDEREGGFCFFRFVLEFLIELDGFGGRGGGGALVLVFVGGGPVDKRVGEFFPFFALRAVVADAVSFDLLFGDQLVGAVFEDETVHRGFVLRREWKYEQEGDECEAEVGVRAHEFAL